MVAVSVLVATGQSINMGVVEEGFLAITPGESLSKKQNHQFEFPKM